ncbi:MAG: DNA polymerase III subunit delta [Chlorobi bacterium]|nr:DNA polymerase III subunit delta [Chlorobiota bacterium]
MVLKYEQILAELEKKIYRPIYFLIGEEAFYIDKITDYIIENVLTEEEKAFNQTILYGRDTDVVTVINTAKRFPMMSNYQIVVLKEGQYLKKFEDLVYYAEHPVKSTILVINYKYSKIDRRKKFYKALLDNGVILESKKLYENQIPQWIISYLKAKNYSIEPKAAALLIEFIGTDLEKIANELNKLFIIVPEFSTITPDIIEKNIGISKEFNAFELQKALGTRNIVKTYQIIDYLGKNQNTNHISVTIAILNSFFSKVLLYHQVKSNSNINVASILKTNPYFVKDYQQAAQNFNVSKLFNIISLLREYDVRSKGVESLASAGELLKELSFKILN